MRCVAFALVMLLAPAASAETFKDLDHARTVVKQVMAQVHAGNVRGGLELLKPYSLVPEAEVEVGIQQSSSQFPLIASRFGRSVGFEILREEEAGPYFYRISVLQRFERHALRWRFIFYRRDKEWTLNTFFFDDKVHELFSFQG